MAYRVQQSSHRGVVGLVTTRAIRPGEIPAEVSLEKTRAVLVMAFKAEAWC